MKQILGEGARGDQRVEPDHWWDKQHSLVLRQTPRWAQSFVLGMILLVGGSIGASAIIRVDEVINVEGILVPTEGTVDVKSPAGGLISEVFVKDGEQVKKGQILVKFDTRKAIKELERLELQLSESTKTYNSRIRTLEKRISAIRQKYDTNIGIYERFKYLEANGAADRSTVLQQRDSVLELESKIIEVEENMLQLESEFMQQVEEIKSRIFLNEIQIQYETVRAPKSGVVFESKAVEKGVLNSGQIILKVVPQDKLMADVWVTNKDIGYVKVGQKANVRVDAFDYTEFGELKGVIKSISPDALPPDQKVDQYRYGVKIDLASNSLKRNEVTVPVITGMSINANIKLRDKRLISIVSDIFSDNEDAIEQLRQ